MFACGRYEGIDARVTEYAAQRMAVDEISLGDYVLAGGEVAVLVIAEAVARLVPGVLGNADRRSTTRSRRPDGLLEAPSYTKPASWRGLDVPAVLLSGHHGEIAAWRRAQSVERTRAAAAGPAGLSDRFPVGRPDVASSWGCPNPDRLRLRLTAPIDGPPRDTTELAN